MFILKIKIAKISAVSVIGKMFLVTFTIHGFSLKNAYFAPKNKI